MTFIEAMGNVCGAKARVDDAGSFVWGIKRHLSLHGKLLAHVAQCDRYHFTLGNDRFYRYLVMRLPKGRFMCRGIKIAKEKPLLTGEMEKRFCLYYGCTKREIPTVLELLDRQGIKRKKIKSMFGGKK